MKVLAGPSFKDKRVPRLFARRNSSSVQPCALRQRILMLVFVGGAESRGRGSIELNRTLSTLNSNVVTGFWRAKKSARWLLLVRRVQW